MSKGFFDYFPPPQFIQMPFLGLDISSRAVRVLELQKHGSAYSVGKYGERLLKTPIETVESMLTNEELKKAIQSLQREFKIRFVKASLPEEGAYLFKTEVEGTDDDEIRTAIEFHLEENVPLSGEEAVFDFHILRKKDHDHTVVTVTVVPKATIDTYTELLHSCNITPLSFHLEPTAVSRSVVGKDDRNSYIIVNLGQTKTDICVTSEGAVQFTSTVNIGSDSFNAVIAKQFSVSEEQAESIKQEKGFLRQDENGDLFAALANGVSVLKDEIERIYMYWQSHKDQDGQVGKKIEKILLVGKDSSLLGFRDHLALSLRLPVEIGNVWTNLFSFDDVIPTINQSDSLNYAATVGLTLPKDL